MTKGVSEKNTGKKTRYNREKKRRGKRGYQISSENWEEAKLDLMGKLRKGVRGKKKGKKTKENLNCSLLPTQNEKKKKKIMRMNNSREEKSRPCKRRDQGEGKKKEDLKDKKNPITRRQE